MANETLLVISPFGVPPYSARGISETLQLIPAAAQLRRTVNGGIVNLAPSQFAKYRVIWSCEDIDPPALDDVFPGALVTADCLSDLAYLTATGSPSHHPGRTIVPGSQRTEGDFTFYRLRLSLMIVAFEIETDEYGARRTWRIEAEER